MAWHLGQLNVARLLHPIDDPATAQFVAALEPINRLAEASPGFVWRLQDESGDATAIDVFGDPLLIVNMSVWESIESLRDFTYHTNHRTVLRRRAEWFEGRNDPHLVLWWIEAGQVPTTDDAGARLGLLRANGPTPKAFTFRTRFDPPI